MNQRQPLMERMVAALERMAPALAPPQDWSNAPGYRWSNERTVAIDQLGATPLATLVGIDPQKQAVHANLLRLAQGYAAHDMLLWGARGMGKSALIAATVAEIQAQDAGQLALIEIGHASLGSIDHLLGQLEHIERAFVVLIDDLGFASGRIEQVLALRSALEGGIVARPDNVRFAVTSNRRAILDRRAREQDSPLNDRDDRDDALALADRFGLTLGFHPCDRATYLAMVRAYLDPLGLDFVEEEAIAWSIARGSLSGRIAHQFAVEVAGRSGHKLA